MDEDQDSGLEIDPINHTVPCPLMENKKDITIYRCIELPPPKVCKRDDTGFPYKLPCSKDPLDDRGSYHGFDKWWGNCKKCNGVLVNRYGIIISILCGAENLTTEDK